MTARKTAGTDGLDDDSVAGFLVDEPDFFTRRPEVLAKLKVPHSSGATVSLIEKQVEVLRGQNRSLERKLVDLIEVARANDAAIERIHQLALTLMESTDLSELLTNLQDVLRSRFMADEVAIVLFQGDAAALAGSPARRLERDAAPLEQFTNFIKANKPHCGRLRPPQLEFLFGDKAGAIGSCALIPLGPRAELGLLAIGAGSEDQFAPTLGTVYLTHIGELVATALAPRLK
jgi:uncharacterized protein YigA (DUF484 family)